jgi:hypothetical protein
VRAEGMQTIQQMMLVVDFLRIFCHLFSQIRDEKSGITMLKRLSHGILDPSAAFVDVTSTPLCCSSVAG